MTNSSDESQSESESESTVKGISDDRLPEDLRPDDNPLAEGLEAGETAGDNGPGELLEEGKTTADGEEEPESSSTVTAPEPDSDDDAGGDSDDDPDHDSES